MSTAIARNHHETLSTELTRMRTERRSAAAARLKAALEASGGARDEAVEAAEQEREQLEARIQSLDDHLRRAEVMEGDAAPGTVGLGSRVTVRRGPGGPARTYTLVLPLGGDPRNGLLTVDSPLGQALMGRRPGETLTVDGPRGPQQVTVDAIE